MFKLLGSKVYPIAIDLGSASLKMVQLMDMDGGLGLVAAAKEDVPSYVQGHAAALQEWYIKTIKEMLADKPFKGNRAVSCLPSREMLVQHLRVAQMGEAELERALPWEAQSKVPFDIHQAMLRHIVAGVVYEGDETKLEVILMAASNQVLRQHLQLIERTKVQVDQVNVEPCALLACFAHLSSQGDGQGTATMYVDLGHHGTKLLVTHGADVVFCRSISIAAEHLRRALCDKLGVDYEQAGKMYRELEVSVSQAVPTAAPTDASLAVAATGAKVSAAATTATTVAASSQLGETDAAAAVALPLDNLCEEMRSCVRYHDLMFNADPVRRVIFLGGMAKNKSFCKRLARGLGLPAQLGDPLARILPQSRVGAHSDLEDGEMNSDWAVAFGLSLGGRRGH